MGAKRPGSRGETTRLNFRRETTRGETTRGEMVWGETSCYHPEKQVEIHANGHNIIFEKVAGVFIRVGVLFNIV